MRKTLIAIGACFVLLGCAGPNGELPRLDASAQQSSSGIAGPYVGANGAFSSLGNH